MPQWLFDECYESVGDLAETIAHVVCDKKEINDDFSVSLHKKIRSFMEIKNADERKKTPNYYNLKTKQFYQELLIFGNKLSTSSTIVSSTFLRKKNSRTYLSTFSVI